MEWFVPAVFSLGLALGFTVGIKTYAQMYAKFKLLEEQKAAKKVALAVSEAKQKKFDAKEIIAKMHDMYGSDISAKHEAVITEEVEKILSAGPGRNS